MRFIKASLYLAATSCCLASVGATVSSPHKSKEEALAAFQSFHEDLSEKHPHHHVPPQVKSFVARKESRRDISKFLSKYVKDTVISELVGSDNKSKGGTLKGKVARFLFNQKKNKMLNKMRSRNTNTNNASPKEEDKKEIGNRRTNQLTDVLFPWTKKPSFESSPDVKQAFEDNVAEVSYDHDDYYYRPPTLFDILDQLSMLVTGLNQTDYTEISEGLTSLIHTAANIPSPEEFCADFDVTSTVEECVGAVSAVTALVNGAIQAPWLLRDIVGYAEAVVEEVVSWETVEGLAEGIMSMYGADGTIDGGLGAIRGIISDLFAVIAAVDPYFSYYFPELEDFGGLMFDLLPLSVATQTLAFDYNFLEDFGHDIHETFYYIAQDIGYILGEGYFDLPEGLEFHADACEAFGLVPANVTAVISCDYFRDIGQASISTENVEFCVEPDQDMEDYSAELFSMESSFEKSALKEANMDGFLTAQGIGYILGEGYIEMPDGPEFHVDLCAAFDLVPANVTAMISCDYFEDIKQAPLSTEGISFCVEPDQDMEDYSAELFSMESSFEKSALKEANMEWIFDYLQYKSWKFDNFNFTALESMTCSIKSYLTQPLVCNEKPLNTFSWKDGEEKTCKWLRNRKQTEKICDEYYTARYACPSTCCMCDEDPMATFFRRYVEVDGVNVPEMKTCKWLATKTPEKHGKFCNKNFAPGDLKTASGACPVTCGFCEGRDLCQEAIDDFFATTTYLDWYDPKTYASVYLYNYITDDYPYAYMYYYDQYGNYMYLGGTSERYENTLLLDYGDYCDEEQRSITSKVIVETTSALGMNGTYFSQSSPCSYELKVVIFCEDSTNTNSTNTTSSWSGRNLVQKVLEHFYPQPEDEILDWQK
eukprot:CAMPEP_0203683928 /NCGR_PEP_ID=MMETSP0090-20130426/47771_1 /ASSEMBLY_ACC=CAM_ASM_001088 /TAXON_ID=426623 /ORGANISM="Chaetoceros affinis, Strain CCMP159" /LENGTH=877 /DNA_ID=CAMNT_0050553085 /DNA_START=55 /DNA_END=2689 /DNA_ORIENTATION=+